MIKKSQIQLKKKTPHQTRKSGQVGLTYQTCKPC